VHASVPTGTGIARWLELEHVDPANVKARYFAAADARNLFVAAVTTSSRAGSTSVLISVQINNKTIFYINLYYN